MPVEGWEQKRAGLNGKGGGRHFMLRCLNRRFEPRRHCATLDALLADMEGRGESKMHARREGIHGSHFMLVSGLLEVLDVESARPVPYTKVGSALFVALESMACGWPGQERRLRSGRDPGRETGRSPRRRL
jgi:hypothetical protein